jgi:hypothetical protein
VVKLFTFTSAAVPERSHREVATRNATNIMPGINNLPTNKEK